MLRLFDNASTKLIIEEHEKLRHELAAPILKDIEKTNSHVESLANSCMSAYTEYLKKGVTSGFETTEAYLGQLIGEAETYSAFLEKNSTSSLEKNYNVELNIDLRRLAVEKLQFIKHHTLASIITSLSTRVQHFNTLVHREIMSVCSKEAYKQLKNLKNLADSVPPISTLDEEKNHRSFTNNLKAV